MTKHTFMLEGEHTVTKGPRDKSWSASATCDLTKLTTDIVQRLAIHGLQQKIADAAAGATNADEATAAMNKAIDAVIAGDWTSRTSGDGVDERTRVARSVVFAALKAKFGAKSPEWAEFTGRSDEDQRKRLDEIFAENEAVFAPSVDEEIERRRAKAAAKANLAKAVDVKL